MLIYQIATIVILAALLLNTANNLRLLRRPDTSSSPEGTALVSLLVPARNEARAIAQCLESLAHQDYPRCEILVLDDQSEDETAEIAAALARRYPQVRVLRGEPLPLNWHGKAFACAQLAQAAHGDWLLFVDADTILAPHCVSVAIRQAEERRADLLTMMPRMVARSFGEALLLPIIPLTFVAFLPLGLVMDHPSPLFAGALGPFLLFRRETYQRIGGHMAVRRDIVEDMRLSQIVKRHGGRVVWIDGTTLMRVRMYRSFAEAWRGIAKSSFAAINYSLFGLVLGVPLCLGFFLGPYILLAAGLTNHLIPGVNPWLSLAQIALLWAAQFLLMRRFGLSVALVPLQAVTIVAMVLATVYSASQTAFGRGVIWKGRAYQFDTLHQRAARRAGWASALVVARLLIAVLLLLSVWLIGRLPLAAALLLLLWTAALLERQWRATENHWTVIADMAGGLACLGYLQLSGLLSIWLALFTALVIALCARWFSWAIAGTVASVLGGVFLLLTAELYAPNTILLGWFLLVALVAGRPVAHALVPWLQRLRSS